VAACGWCLAFNDECCHGRFEWCEHGRRCDMANLTGTVRWADTGKTWCFEHGREDWCANKERREGIQMSKVIEEAQELLDAEVREVLTGTYDPEAAKLRARGMVEAMAVFTGRPADDLAREAVARVQARA